MKFTNLTNNINIPVTVRYVHIIDFDNMNTSMQIKSLDTPNTMIIGAIFNFSTGVIDRWKTFGKKLKNAAFRIVMFEGATIPDMGDHMVTFLAARWISLNPSMPSADWHIHTNDGFGRCLSLILNAFGVSNRLILSTQTSTGTTVRICGDSEISGKFVFTEGMRLGAAASALDKLGGHNVIFKSKASKKMADVFRSNGFSINSGLIYTTPKTIRTNKDIIFM